MTGDSMEQDEVDPNPLDMLTRAHIYDQLEFFGSFDDQRQYAAAVPYVHMPSELINGWEDWVHCPPGARSQNLGAFTIAEVRALAHFHRVWDATADAIPVRRLSLEEVQAHPAWCRLRDEANATLAILGVRGIPIEPAS